MNFAMPDVSEDKAIRRYLSLERPSRDEQSCDLNRNAVSEFIIFFKTITGKLYHLSTMEVKICKTDKK